MVICRVTHGWKCIVSRFIRVSEIPPIAKGPRRALVRLSRDLDRTAIRLDNEVNPLDARVGLFLTKNSMQ